MKTGCSPAVAPVLYTLTSILPLPPGGRFVGAARVKISQPGAAVSAEADATAPEKPNPKSAQPASSVVVRRLRMIYLPLRFAREPLVCDVVP